MRLEEVSDARLQTGLSELLTAGFRTEARIIAHLAEVERRKLHLSEGSESLFDYCVRKLHLSNSEAFHRITAARICAAIPDSVRTARTAPTASNRRVSAA